MTSYTRRDFAKLALAALPAAGLLAPAAVRGAEASASAQPAKPNSKVSGVQLGLNVPYSLGNSAMSADEILAACVQLGISAVELRAQPIEAFLGAPAELVNARADVASGGAAQANAEQLRQWRLGVSPARVAEFRKKYEDAGVLIEILKVDRIFAMPDEVLDYVFTLARGVGARAISTEISRRDEDHQRLGRFADKHQIWMSYHGHASTGPAHWEKLFGFAKFNAANVDLGHFIAGNNVSLVEFILKHHARITHVHLKDRRIKEGPNVPFGEGDTPLVEVLRLIRDHRWPIQGTIEHEYRVPAGSTKMAEISRALKYCRDALA